MKPILIYANKLDPGLKDEIQAGRLIPENCVVIAGQEQSEVSFYLHKEKHVFSQLSRPAPSILENYDQIRLPCKPVADIVNAYGSPFYIKIDIEHYDAPILQSLFQHNFYPPYISAESHAINVFSIFLAQRGYNAFKLVDGRSVSSDYANRTIQCERTKDLVKYSFPYHSAGPFGCDSDGE
ncbi:FkbM family methyltransferase [Synechococcus sp. 1G10]|uniref:FkbM family methyltransferase n=1 Tax=Synechococcus sp. 1G10 TaxID=2025605 RepID=UPI00117CFF08|nr:FkbM family methyltransferase [Synechococcus sp. 1G10]